MSPAPARTPPESKVASETGPATRTDDPTGSAEKSIAFTAFVRSDAHRVTVCSTSHFSDGMLMDIDRTRVRFGPLTAVALAILSFMAAHCREAPRSEPRPIAAPQLSSSGFPQAASSSPRASASELLPVAPAASTPSPPPSSVTIAKGPVVIERVEVVRGGHTDAAPVIDAMRPAFIRCYRRALARPSARGASLQGRLRLRLSVAASGTVNAVDLPQWAHTKPSFELGASGSPTPNPTHPDLRQVFIPCLEASVRQSRFGVLEQPSMITVDIRIP
jgi:hypothetical protein